MGNFCKYCGRALQEGEVCHCREQSGSSDQQSQYTDMGSSDQMGQQYKYVMKKQFLPSYDVNAFAILSLVLGILSLCVNGGVIPAVLAIVFSNMAKKRTKSEDLLGQKFTKAGLILGIIGCAVWAINIWLGFMGVLTLGMLF